MASGVLEEFRSDHPEHELQAEATKQLAFIYREDGQIERSAAEHERIAAESTDPELSREALLTAAELYDEVNVTEDAIRVYEQYVIRVSAAPRYCNGNSVATCRNIQGRLDTKAITAAERDRCTATATPERNARTAAATSRPRRR